MDKLVETPTEVQQVAERYQSQEIDALTGALVVWKPQMSSAATEDTLLGVENTTSDAGKGMTTTWKSLMCPIHRLPPELLREIFQKCQFNKPNINKMLITLSLASVCQYWRTVTCSFGVLWCYIAFSARYKKGLAMFMKRSSYDLALSIDEDSLNWAPHHFPPYRVRRLFIVLEYDLDAQNIFSRWSVVLPNLYHLHIKTNRLNSVRTISGDFLSLFPCLENLELFQVNLHFSKHFELLKLQRISWVMNVDPKPLRYLLGDICSHAPHLKSFVFYGPCLSRGSETTGMAFGPLTELNALEIDFPDLLIMGSLTDPLMIPYLQHLMFRWVPLSELWEVKRLNYMFLRYASLASLTHLTLILDSYGGYSKLEYTNYQLDCLVHLVRLTRLDITGVDGAEYHEEHPSIYHICYLLSVRTSKQSFPCLQTIHFIGKITIGVCIGTVIRMAKARTTAAASSQIAKLESIIFEDCEPLTVKQYRELRDALGQNCV